MKKILFSLIIISLTICTNAQSNFISLGVGSYPGARGIPVIQLEISHKYKFVEFGFSVLNNSTLPIEQSNDILRTNLIDGTVLDSKNDFTGLTTSAYLFNVKFDLLQFLKNNTKHKLNIGIGSGIGERIAITQSLKSSTGKFINIYRYNGLVYNLLSEYKFDLNSKFSIGVRFDVVQTIDIATISLMISRKF